MKEYRVLFLRMFIKIGKLLPYILCSILLIEHCESLYAFENNMISKFIRKFRNKGQYSKLDAEILKYKLKK